jgi:hypothetical protein
VLIKLDLVSHGGLYSAGYGAWVTGPGITIYTIFKIDFRVLNLAHLIAHALAPLAVSEKLPDQFSRKLRRVRLA